MFRNFSAFVVTDKSGKFVACIAIKYGGSVTLYAHWLGLEMTKGRAGGGGYDRASAACRQVASKMPLGLDAATGMACDREGYYLYFRRALIEGDNGAGWIRCLEKVGFQIYQAI